MSNKVMKDDTGQAINTTLQSLVDAIRGNMGEVDSIQLGYIVGKIIRFGRLRIITVYCVSDQTATETNLNSKDIPSSDYSITNWVLIAANTYGTRNLIVGSNGKLSLDNSMARGSFVGAYLVD